MVSEDVLTDTARAGADQQTVMSDPEPRARPEPGASSGRMLSTAREFGWLTAAVALVVGVVVRPWSLGWSTPIVYGNDTLSHLAMLDRVGWTGTARGTTALGAPYGLTWTDFPLGPDRLHFIAFRILRLFGGDRMLTLNLYFLLGFFLIAWASFAVLRALRISPLVAGAVSIVFTLAPYHFARIEDGHVFLAAYFAVPLGVLLAVWASDGHITRTMPRARLAAIVACVLIVGSSSAYYAIFTLVLVVSSGTAVAVRRSEWRALVVPGVIVLSIGAVVVVNTAGTLWTNRSIGANSEVAARPASDSADFGLRLTQMISPVPGHRVPAMAALGDAAVELDTPGETGSAIGLLAVAGLVCIAVSCLRRRDRPSTPEDSLMARLGVMAVAAIVVATTGGLSFLVAILGFGQIRVWSRMSIVISFLGLVGLAVVLDHVRRSEVVASHRAGASLLAILIVTVAVFDQTPPDLESARAAYQGASAVDREAAAQMESVLPASAQVFALPYTAFLFGVADGEMPQYALLGPWAMGDDSLGFSAAGMQGRGADWQRSWTTQPPGVMMSGLAAAGFDAVYLDRRSELGSQTGTSAQGSNTVAESTWLRRTVGAPTARIDDGEASREFFDVSDLRDVLVERLGAERVRELGEAVRRPIGVTFGGAADRYAVADGARLMQADSTVTLRDEAVGAGPVRVRFELSATPGSTVQIRVGEHVEQVQLRDQPMPVELELPMDQRDNVIRLTTDAPRLAGAAARHGDVRLWMSQVQVIDIRLEDAIAAGEFDTGSGDGSE